MSTQTVEALLFDFGGVLVDIDFERAFRHWETISALSLEDLRIAFQFDLPYQQHERGELSAEKYFDHLRSCLQLQGSDEQIALGWNSIYVGEISETVTTVQAVRTTYPCYAFTNSNTSHQSVWRPMFPGVVAAFNRVFVSSDIGLRKPEHAAFEFIANAIAVPKEAILFFDDLSENVAGAREAGLQAVHVRSSADVRKALLQLGCAL